MKFIETIVKAVLYLISLFMSVVFLGILYGYFFADNSIERITKKCQAEIADGGFAEYTNPLEACLEDFSRAEAGADMLVAFSIVPFMLSVLFIYFGRKIKLTPQD